MSSPFVAEIRIFAGNFAPTGWASCDGQLLPLSQNTALFSLLGTNFGGDGKSNFALPNFQASAAVNWGSGPGLTDYSVGQTGGSETVTLLQTELPTHNHNLFARAVTGNVYTADPTLSIAKPDPATNAAYQTVATPLTQMNPQALNVAGSSLPHNNMQPYLALFFIIALQGIYPPRT